MSNFPVIPVFNSEIDGHLLAIPVLALENVGRSLADNLELFPRGEQ